MKLGEYTSFQLLLRISFISVKRLRVGSVFGRKMVQNITFLSIDALPKVNSYSDVVVQFKSKF